MKRSAAPLVLILLAAGSAASAQDWPGWRGPRGDGTSKESGFPLHWSATEKVLWKIEVPGKGHSSPVIWGDRLFVTTCLEETGERKLICYDRRDGRLLWEQGVLKSVLERKHDLNSYASSTPVTDGRHVWLAFLDKPQFRVYCYDMEGKLVWQANPGTFNSPHGFCSSPVLYKDLVIFNGDQDAVAWLIGLDQATGELRWRTDRPNRTRSYSPPVIFDAGGKTQLVLSGSKCVASYDPGTGKQIWIIDGPTEQFAASMVYTAGLFFITGGFPEYHILGIKPDGEGNITKTHILWRDGGDHVASYVPSPVAWKDWFFLTADIGEATCFEATTGKRLWHERLGRHFSGSPVAANDYLYFTDDDGITTVLKAGSNYEVVAKNELGEKCFASPALSRGRIYLRALKHLYCIGDNDSK